jgi:hypothetical protein
MLYSQVINILSTYIVDKFIKRRYLPPLFLLVYFVFDYPAIFI